MKFFIFFLLSALLSFGCFKNPHGSKIVVLKIVDGDTYHLSVHGKLEKVRLIGVDTPESFKNSKTIRDSKRSSTSVELITKMGKRATAFVKQSLKVGDYVSLEYDVQKRDKYGRLLVYLFLADGSFLNDLLVKNGYATPLTYPPNIKYEKLFLQSYQHARQNNLGLWMDN